ncbi:anti-sigma factor family protein [Streptosporangium saharense]|uniref:anti-sigma factor family protein n=1 Tax=Streptosporangium saharense TaxID=1706840 RepID=UPI00332223A1
MSRASLGCREVGGLVTGYLEGVLPAGTRRSFEEHLTRCALCPALLERVRVTVEVLRAFGGGDVPQEVLARLCAAFDAPGGPVRASGRRHLSSVPGSGAAPLLDPGVPPVAEGGQ